VHGNTVQVFDDMMEPQCWLRGDIRQGAASGLIRENVTCRQPARPTESHYNIPLQDGERQLVCLTSYGCCAFGVIGLLVSTRCIRLFSGNVDRCIV
jgi:hypothetical protein